MNEKIILAHNAKEQSKLNKLKRKNRDLNAIWRKIHEAIYNGNFSVYVSFNEVIDFNFLQKTFEHYGYQCNIREGELKIEW